MIRKPTDPFARKMWQGAFIYGGMMLAMFAVLTVVYLHARPRCSERMIGQADSPGARFAAAILERRCGDDTPFFTHVNIGRVGEPVSRGFFSGKVAEGEVFLVEQDAAGSGLSMQWLGPDTLLVHCPNCAASLLRKQEERWNGILIKYDPAVR